MLKVELTTSGVANSEFASCVYNGKLLIHGGEVGVKKLNDLRMFDLESRKWSDFDGVLISKRAAHAMVECDGCIYILGGFDIAPLGDMWCFSPKTNRWRIIPTPINNIHYHTMVTRNNSIYICGGYSSYDLHCYYPESDEWEKKTSDIVRTSHVSCIYKDHLYTHGGKSFRKYNIIGDIWSDVFNINAPPVTKSHASCVCNDKMYIFGDITHDNNLYEFDFNCSMWFKYETNIIGRFSCTLVEINNKMVLYGGYNNDTKCEFGDTVIFQVFHPMKISMNFVDIYFCF